MEVKQQGKAANNRTFGFQVKQPPREKQKYDLENEQKLKILECDDM